MSANGGKARTRLGSMLAALRSRASRFLLRVALRCAVGVVPMKDRVFTVLQAMKEVGFIATHDVELLELISGHTLRSRAGDVMLVRVEIPCIEYGASLDYECLNKLVTQHRGVSRVLVINDSIDSVVGYVNLSDLISVAHHGLSIDVFLRKAMVVHASTRAIDLWRFMMINNIDVAVVVDEYHGTEGMVTVEQLAGLVVDRELYGLDAAPGALTSKRGVISDVNDYAIEIDGRMSIDVLVRYFDGEFVPNREGPEEIDTVGGLVFDLFGYVPEEGEICYYKSGLALAVKQVVDRRVARVVAYRFSEVQLCNKQGDHA